MFASLHQGLSKEMNGFSQSIISTLFRQVQLSGSCHVDDNFTSLQIKFVLLCQQHKPGSDPEPRNCIFQSSGPKSLTLCNNIFSLQNLNGQLPLSQRKVNNFSAKSSVRIWQTITEPQISQKCLIYILKRLMGNLQLSLFNFLTTQGRIAITLFHLPITPLIQMVEAAAQGKSLAELKRQLVCTDAALKDFNWKLNMPLDYSQVQKDDKVILDHAQVKEGQVLRKDVRAPQIEFTFPKSPDMAFEAMKLYIAFERPIHQI